MKVLSVDPGTANFGFVLLEVCTKTGVLKVLKAKNARIGSAEDSWEDLCFTLVFHLKQEVGPDFDIMVVEDNAMGMSRSVPANVFVQAACGAWACALNKKLVYMRPREKFVGGKPPVKRQKCKEEAKSKCELLLEEGKVEVESPEAKTKLLRCNHLTDALTQAYAYVVTNHLRVPSRAPRREPCVPSEEEP